MTNPNDPIDHVDPPDPAGQVVRRQLQTLAADARTLPIDGDALAGRVKRRRAGRRAVAGGVALGLVLAAGIAAAQLIEHRGDGQLAATGQSTNASLSVDHGALTDREFSLAVAAARAEVDRDEAVITSATATIGDGTVSDPNVGPACTSGRVLMIQLLGTFPHITTGALGGAPTPTPKPPISGLLLTADAVSGKVCLIGTLGGPRTPEPGAAILLSPSTGPSSADGHGGLSDREFALAVAAARAEVDKEAADITSATATIGDGTVTDSNVGSPCTSGMVFHIKLIGTFPRIAIGLQPTATGTSPASPLSASAVLLTADAESGKACLIGVQTGPTTPEPGSALLFTK